MSLSCALRRLIAGAFVLATLLGGAVRAQAPITPINIAAASDLKFALPELAAAFERGGASKLQISFGSSGNFRRQIAEGAPFELFFSADEGFADALIAEGRGIAPGALYGIGRLALFVPNGSAVKADAELKDLRAAAADGRLSKLAIANPEHAPYGRAAREALAQSGALPALQHKLVLGENVAQAARFATTGGAQAGILPLALVLAPELARQGRYVLLPDTLHAPLRQKVILLKGAGPEAQKFLDFVRSPAGTAILKRHGFDLPR